MDFVGFNGVGDNILVGTVERWERSLEKITMDIGYKAGVGTRKNWPYNQYGLISDVTMEGAGEGVEGLK